MTHVEVIDPMEKVDRGLGGLGYQPPREPATAAVLAADASASAVVNPKLNAAVWKVARTSVAWNKGPHRASRLLKIGRVRIPCKVLGTHRHWYFVAVQAREAADALFNR